MSESFKELFEQSTQKEPMASGTLLKGIVSEIKRDHVVVNVGLKSEGVIPIAQFYDDDRKINISVGD